MLGDYSCEMLWFDLMNYMLEMMSLSLRLSSLYFLSLGLGSLWFLEDPMDELG